MKPFVLNIEYNSHVKHITTKVMVRNPDNTSGGVFSCLIDTGSGSCVISERVASVLSLEVKGDANLHTGNGKLTTNYCLADYYFPVENDWIVFKDIISIIGKPIDIDILIGMDILEQGDVYIENTSGKTRFIFTNIPKAKDEPKKVSIFDSFKNLFKGS